MAKFFRDYPVAYEEYVIASDNLRHTACAVACRLWLGMASSNLQ
jgi:hypothetical protein